MQTLLPDGLSELAALLLVLTAWLTAAITAAFGLGGGMILLAILLGVMPPAMAIPVHGVLQLGANASRTWLLRGEVLRRELLWFLPGAMVGVALAALVVVDLPTRWLSVAPAIFILWSVWAPTPERRLLSPRRFALLGLATSFATMFISATGPLVAAFLPPERYGRLATVATQGACMSAQHLFKIVALGLLGFSLAAIDYPDAAERLRRLLVRQAGARAIARTAVPDQLPGNPDGAGDQAAGGRAVRR